jgi:choline dehydrogenase-like flavoprotein
MHYVIGSGPAAVSCAMAVLNRGEEVTMLDAGFALEPDAARAVAEMSRQTPGEWGSESLARMKVLAHAGGAPRKLVYGSSYAYRRPDGYAEAEGKGVDFAPSFAIGGLSNVWGAAMLPYRQEDIDEWPIGVEELAPYYARVLEFVPLTGRLDALAALFPLYTSAFQEHTTSRQGARVLRAMERHREALNREGISFGSSRLAVETKGCVYCGMCMFGCPYDLIYSSRHTLSRLGERRGFRYLGGVVVERFAERGGAVAIEGRTLSGEPVSFEGERLFLGAGPLPTTQIVMDSLEIDETTLLDSQYFRLPLLQATGGGARREELHTLAQAFIELLDPAISRRTVHMQLYTYNDIYELELRRRFGRLYPFMPAGPVLDRMLLIQGFLHSDDSLKVRVRRRGSRLSLHKVEDSRPRQTAGRVARKLARNSLRIGAAPLLPLLEVELPGRSFHDGGTLPMRADPQHGQTDTLGRPAGLQRVHVIDSSVFPTIPATTITLSVMANAYRIGAEHAD